MAFSDFVEFMLSIIRDMLAEIVNNQKSYDDGINEKLLQLLKINERMSAREAAEILNLSQRQVERRISNLKKAGRLTREGANKNGVWKVL